MNEGSRPFGDSSVFHCRSDIEPRRVVSRRGLLKAAVSLAAISSVMQQSRAAASTAGLMSIGITEPAYYGGFSPFLNWWKQAASLQIICSDGKILSGEQVWTTGTYLDPTTGDLANPVAHDVVAISRIIFASPSPFQQDIGCDYSGETFMIAWDGAAHVTVENLTAGGFQTALGPNSATFKLGSSPGNTAVTFSIIDRQDPPTNIRVFQSRYAGWMEQGYWFNPDWLNVVRQFGLIRCMGWCAVNNSTIANFDQLADAGYFAWGQLLRSTAGLGEYGPKGGVHPEILCKLANESGAPIHVCIPHLATDECVNLYASYFRDYAQTEVTFELGNECWNAAFHQFEDYMKLGNALWPNDPTRAYKYYGYRAAACMDLVRNVYGSTVRWRGVLATQTVNPAVTEAIFKGVEMWKARSSERKRSTATRDLFDALLVTGYFGDVTTCTQPVFVSQANPAIVTSPQHGYETGEQVRCFFATAMTELNNRDVTVRKIDNDTYSIAVDTSGLGPFVADTQNYVAPANVFKLIESSRQRHKADAQRFPTPYTYFNQQVSESMLTGKSDEFVTKVNVKALAITHWPAQMVLARAQRLDLQQYEGGCHLVGDAYLTGYGGNPLYTEFLLQHGHCSEVAAVYSAMYQAFVKLGGSYPSKFVMDGNVSQFGTWAGIRYWPTAANLGSIDIGNPVWRATVEANRR